jgi:hypothetical protein
MSVSTVVVAIDRSGRCVCEIELFGGLLKYNIIDNGFDSRKQLKDYSF